MVELPKEIRDKISKSLIEFYQTKKGKKLREEQSKRLTNLWKHLKGE